MEVEEKKNSGVPVNSNVGIGRKIVFNIGRRQLPMLSLKYPVEILLIWILALPNPNGGHRYRFVRLMLQLLLSPLLMWIVV